MLAVNPHHGRRDAEGGCAVLDALRHAKQRPDRVPDVVEPIACDSVAKRRLDAPVERAVLVKDSARHLAFTDDLDD